MVNFFKKLKNFGSSTLTATIVAAAVVGGSAIIIKKTSDNKQIRNTAMANYEIEQIVYGISRALGSASVCAANFDLSNAPNIFINNANQIVNPAGEPLFLAGQNFGSSSNGASLVSMQAGTVNGTTFPLNMTFQRTGSDAVRIGSQTVTRSIDINFLNNGVNPVCFSTGTEEVINALTDFCDALGGTLNGIICESGGNPIRDAIIADVTEQGCLHFNEINPSAIFTWNSGVCTYDPADIGPNDKPNRTYTITKGFNSDGSFNQCTISCSNHANYCRSDMLCNTSSTGAWACVGPSQRAYFGAGGTCPDASAFQCEGTMHDTCILNGSDPGPPGMGESCPRSGTIPGGQQCTGADCSESYNYNCASGVCVSGTCIGPCDGIDTSSTPVGESVTGHDGSTQCPGTLAECPSYNACVANDPTATCGIVAGTQSCTNSAFPDQGCDFDTGVICECPSYEACVQNDPSITCGTGIPGTKSCDPCAGGLGSARCQWDPPRIGLDGSTNCNRTCDPCPASLTGSVCTTASVTGLDGTTSCSGTQTCNACGKWNVGPWGPWSYDSTPNSCTVTINASCGNFGGDNTVWRMTGEPVGRSRSRTVTCGESCCDGPEPSSTEGSRVACTSVKCASSPTNKN